MIRSSNVGHANRWRRHAGIACVGVLIAFAMGCGDATCPAGSKSVGGQCEPADECGHGMVRKGKTCTLASGIDANDGGVTGRDDEGESQSSSARDASVRSASDAGSASSGPGTGEADAAPSASEGAGSATMPEVPVECVGYDCGSHGHCELAADAPRCACDSGFAGEHCEACEPGYGLEAQTCVPACEADDAPDCGHGTCEVADGAARCACESGYVGDHCEGCEAGLGLKGDECVPACEADAAPSCGAHGSCEVVDDAAQCACEHPFAGASCASCATGFALQSDGSCAPFCGDCGAHAYCDGSLMVPACACRPGYAAGGAGCTWSGDGKTGGIVNGTFADDSGWTLDHASIANHSVTFAPSGTGTNCQLGSLSQTITMPTREQAEALVVEIETTTPCTATDPEACPPLQLELGSSVTRVRVPGGAAGATASQRICLGDAAYGGDVALRIRPGVARVANPFAIPAAGWPCNTAWPTVNSVAIRAARGGECDEPGFIPNGYAPLWDLTGTASISNGILSIGNAALALVDFVAPSASALPGAALQLTVSPQAQAGAVVVELDGMQLSTLRVANTETRFVCLPDWALGTGHELGLRAYSPTMLIGSIGVVSESHCGDGSFDGGFERALETGGWFIHSTGGVDVAVLADSSAYAGNSTLHARNTVLGGAMRFPDADGSNHAALSLAARAGTKDMKGTIAPNGSPPALNATVTVVGSNWTITTFCPGRIWDGQLAQFIVSVSASFATSGATGTPEILLDAFGPSSSSMCP